MNSLLTVALLSGCTGARHVSTEFDQSRLIRPIDAVALAPAQTLDTHDADSFASGTVVGHLIFEGGYITVKQETGQQNVSREVDTSAVDTYRQYAKSHVDRVMTETLQRRKLPTVSWDPPEGLTPPERRPLRGTHPKDGRDNISMPRFEIQATPLPASVLDSIPPGNDAVVVPWVASYYTHNAGWFVGQTYGTAAGARYRVYVGVYDAKSGAMLGWTDTTAIFIHDTIFQPNTGQTEDFLLRTEGKLERLLRSSLR